MHAEIESIGDNSEDCVRYIAREDLHEIDHHGTYYRVVRYRTGSQGGLAQGVGSQGVLAQVVGSQEGLGQGVRSQGDVAQGVESQRGL
ncbi:unnamed protein product [Cochlearia groenlandica]